MASAPDRDSDDDFGYDLSTEDEKLLVSLADRVDTARSTTPASQETGAVAAATRASDATSIPRSSPGGKTAFVGVARTTSIDAFVRKTQPQSAPSLIPTDDVQYPDRTWLRWPLSL